MYAKVEGADFFMTCRGKFDPFLSRIVTKSNAWKENYLSVEIKVGMLFRGSAESDEGQLSDRVEILCSGLQAPSPSTKENITCTGRVLIVG